MADRIYKFEDLIGQTTNKSIIVNQLLNNRLSKFIFLYGDSGSGKSTLAELIAMSATCQHTDLNPCLECERCIDNLNALQTTGSSRNIKKINIGKIISKDDVRKMIKEIFDLQPIPGEKTFYILEEVHLLGRNQDMLLEELERIPDDTHVIMCTTNYNEILDTLKTRAQLKLNFKRLTPTECRILIDRLETEYKVKGLTASDKTFLANVANCNAREITNFLQTFNNVENIGTLLRSYFSKVPTNFYIETVEALFRDFPNFIVYLQDLESTTNILDMWSGFHSFVRDAIFYMYGGSVTLFTNKEKSRIAELFNKIPQDKMSKLYRHTIKSAKTQIDVEDCLINLHEIMHEIIGTPKKTLKVQAAEENITAIQNAAKVTNESHKVEVSKPDLQNLNNVTTNNFTYDLDIDF